LKRAGVQFREQANELVALFPQELGQGAWLFAE